MELKLLIKNTVLFLFFLLPIIFAPFSYQILQIKEILFFLSCFIFILHLFFLENLKIKKILSLFFLFFLWIFLLFFISKYNLNTVNSIGILFNCFLFFLFWTNLEKEEIEKYNQFFIFTFLPFIIIGLLQLVKIDFPPGLLVFGERIPATFGNPNFFAGFLIGILPLPFFYYLKSENQKIKNFYMILFFVLILLLFHTKSKAGYLAFFIQIIFFLLFYTKLREKNKIIFFVIIFFIILILLFLNIKKLFKSESIFFRFYVWKETLNLIKDNFFVGTGPASFNLAFSKYKPEEIMFWAKEVNYEITYPENFYLQILSETGFFGFLIFIAFIFYLFKNAKEENLCFYIGILGILIINFFGVDLNYITSIFLFTFLSSNIIYSNFSEWNIKEQKMKNILIFIFLCFNLFTIVNSFKDFISNTYLNEGVKYSKLREFDLAILNYKKAIYLNKNNIVARYFLANSYYDLKDLNSALKEYEQVEKISEFYLLTNFKKGIIYKEIKEFEKAKQELEKAIKINPYLKEALSELAFIYFNEKEYERSEKLIKQALKKYKEDASLYNNLGNIYFMKKEYQNAIEAYKKAISLKGEKSFYKNLGYVYIVLKDFEKAEECFKKAEIEKNNFKK